jgi:hypothetical protein
MDRAADDTRMGLLLIIVMIAVVGPLALMYGADSRDTTSRPRSWWPAAPRS